MDYKAWVAQHWYGYGRWDAPYWFVGMEPGGTEHHTSYESVYRLGQGSNLLDCREHHLDCGFTRWHREGAGTQHTWRRLIQLLLAFKQRPTTLSQVSEYQQIAWGSTRGETAVLELSALHAPNLATDVDRITHRNERIVKLGTEMNLNAPTFAVFYGTTYRADFERVIGQSFGRGAVQVGATLCVLVSHPTAKSGPGTNPAFWVELGKAMHSDVGTNAVAATNAFLNGTIENAS